MEGSVKTISAFELSSWTGTELYICHLNVKYSKSSAKLFGIVLNSGGGQVFRDYHHYKYLCEINKVTIPNPSLLHSSLFVLDLLFSRNSLM